MILTDREIQIAIDQGFIKLDPLPKEGAVSSTAIDLTLAAKAREFRKTVRSGEGIDPTAKEYKFHQVVETLTELVDINPQYHLKPKNLLLAWTEESLTLPIHSRLAARVEGKSSLARLGLGIHITAPTIHSGFSGVLQLEIVNHGPADIILKPGMRICQIIFETTLGTPAKGYAGIFSGQTIS